MSQSFVFHLANIRLSSWTVSTHHIKLECIKFIELHICFDWLTLLWEDTHNMVSLSLRRLNIVAALCHCHQTHTHTNTTVMSCRDPRTWQRLFTLTHKTQVTASLTFQDLTKLGCPHSCISIPPTSSNDIQVLGGTAHIHRIIEKRCGVTGAVLSDGETLQLVVELSKVGTLVWGLAPACSHYLIPARMRNNKRSSSTPNDQYVEFA